MKTLTTTGELHPELLGPAHLAIEGDNLDVLPHLAGELQGAVDLIYIDPPYNTGGPSARRYSDSFADWPAFMRARLAAARPLLAPLGVILVAIDDAEVHRLRNVMDDVFGARNFLATIIWEGGVTPSARFTGGGVDYMVAYALDRRALVVADVRWSEPKSGVGDVLAAGADAWARSGHDAAEATTLLRRWWKGRELAYDSSTHEYSRIDETGRVFRIGYLGSGGGRHGARFELRHPRTGAAIATPNGGWVANEETMHRWISEGRILFSDDPAQSPWRKLYLDELASRAPEPVFRQRRDQGTKRLAELLGHHAFTTPKDPQVLARWFSIIAGPQATILDFFAGSGTTAEAVLALNRRDGGTRRAVLVTNNEIDAKTTRRLRNDGVALDSDEAQAFGVFRSVTEPRIRSLITGVRPDGVRHGEPWPARVAFLRV